MSRRYRRFSVVVAVAATTGCNLFTGTACTTEARPALLVEVRDSSTNAPAGRGTIITARSGTFADTARADGA